MREQRMEQGVHGISTRKVYPFPELLRESVRSYRTFSPLQPHPGPPQRGGVGLKLFSATLSMLSFSRLLGGRELHPLGGAALYVVRTFLPASD